jgi:hypothetical protein
MRDTTNTLLVVLMSALIALAITPAICKFAIRSYYEVRAEYRAASQTECPHTEF